MKVNDLCNDQTSCADTGTDVVLREFFLVGGADELNCHLEIRIMAPPREY
jgi:hypothetical protein